MKFLIVILIFAVTDLAAQNRYSVIIHEIMADPTPVVGLPSNEWIELKNISSVHINLQGWRIADAGSQSGPFPFFNLEPDSLVIVCSSNSLLSMQTYGTAIPVTSFPSLDNVGDPLFLKNSTGTIIHAVEYSDKWYGNVIKSDGGWTLEMIDSHFPCNGSQNWGSSKDPIGGTPGKKNSIETNNPDDLSPSLLRTYMRDSNTIVAVFDETLDSVSASTVSNYTLTTIPIVAAIPESPFFRKVNLHLTSPLNAATIYTLTVQHVTDCSGNTIGNFNSSRIGRPEPVAGKDIIINEILFNPYSGGSDYVEFYNRSNKVIEANNLFLANRALNGSINSPQQLHPDTFYLFPGDHLAVTSDINNIMLNYLVSFPERIIEHTLPSLPDDEGSVVLMNTQSTIIDEVNYKDTWHFPLITNTDGISLERIDPEEPSQQSHNWHSASSTVGYGTPGYRNSQYKQVVHSGSGIRVDHSVISPDNDGRDDVITVRYRMDQPGFIANVHIYDMNGHTKYHFIKNQLLGMEGTFVWDGLGHDRRPLQAGPYLIITEIFNAYAVVKKFKNVIIVAKKLQ